MLGKIRISKVSNIRECSGVKIRALREIYSTEAGDVRELGEAKIGVNRKR